MSDLGVTIWAMRPALKAGLLPVWRDRDTLQIGVDPRHAIALSGISGAAAVIGLLDGSRDWARIIEAAESRGIPAAAAQRVLGLLAAAGALTDFPGQTLAALPASLRARLAPELATASLAYADGDGGARTLARRRAAFIRVHGGGRIGSCVASFLAATGIGHVTCQDSEITCPQDLTPAGLCLSDLNQPRAHGVARAIQRIAPDVRTDDDGARPDLVVLTEIRDPGTAAALARERVPHLAASAAEAVGVVGPLVSPGRSACLRCLDLAKAERDPAWPLILAQVAGSRLDPQACDTVLAAAVAALAAAQAVAFIDTARPLPAVTNGTLELAAGDWQWRRRSWLPHPHCICGAVRAPTVEATPRHSGE
jgi:bacteriocin biosynthesis cyclodehydratase domain-containing protein